MKQTMTLAAGLALLLSTAPAWAQNAGSPGATKPVGPPDSMAKLSRADKAFVEKASLGGMAEVREGQLAQTQAQSADVKAFGQHMVTDHTDAGQKLKSIVDAEGVPAPTDLDKADQRQIDALRKKSGAGFDKQYVKDQLAAHKKTVALFQQEAASGRDPKLKQFASDTLPTLRQHLSAVEALAKK